MRYDILYRKSSMFLDRTIQCGRPSQYDQFQNFKIDLRILTKLSKLL